MLKRISEAYLAWRKRREAHAKVNAFLRAVYNDIRVGALVPELLQATLIEARFSHFRAGHQISGVLEITGLCEPEWDWKELTIDGVDVRSFRAANGLAVTVGLIMQGRGEHEEAIKRREENERIVELAHSF